MLKRRIIPIELFDSGRLYKTTQFESRRDVGHPVKSSQVYSHQDADELIFLNINRESRCIEQMVETVLALSKSCFVPLSVGGGIKTSHDAARLFVAGADKVIVNSAAYRQPEIITKIAENYGSQAVIVGIDVRKSDSNNYRLFSDCGRQYECIELGEHIDRIIAAGAGEIMIQSIDNDGVMGGYDLGLIALVTSKATVPVIAAGGAGHFMDLKQAIETGANAVACGSLFNFGDNNPIRAKAFLKNYQIPLKVI